MVRCRGKFCRPVDDDNEPIEGVMVYHRFDLNTGDFETWIVPYQNPRVLLGTDDR